MAELFSIFSNNILPIFLVAGAGYVAARFLDLQTESLSKIVFYIFSPCLVFDLLVNTKLDA